METMKLVKIELINDEHFVEIPDFVLQRLDLKEDDALEVQVVAGSIMFRKAR